jgi:hypothetical protein
MQISVLLLGAILIFVGLAMAGMRAGYWIFVVGAKSVVMLALIVTAVIWYVSSAHALTQSEFTSAYQQYVNTAVVRGIYPKRVCFTDYCANQMSLSTKDGEVLLSNMTSNITGLNMQELCVTPLSTPAYRQCASSEGRMCRQHLNGEVWDTYQVLTNHFD